jgi:hypothetical protein
VLGLVLDERLDVLALLGVVERAHHLETGGGDVGPGVAERLEEVEDLLAILDRLDRVVEGDGAALGLVALEEGREVAPPMVRRGNLVREVVGVGDTRVETQATSWGERVRTVAREHGASAVVVVGDLAAEDPGHGRVEVDGNVAPDRCPHNVHALLGGERRERRHLGVDVVDQHVVVLDVVGDDEAARLGVQDPVQHADLVADDGAEVGAKVDGNHGVGRLLALRGDARRLADARVGAVASHHEARLDQHLLARVRILDGGHADRLAVARDLR